MTGLEVAASAQILKTTTNATGANWVQLGNAGGGPVACKQISVYNGTGAQLSFGYGATTASTPTGETFEIPDAASITFRGVSNSNGLFVKRTDGGAQVTFKALAEGV